MSPIGLANLRQMRSRPRLADAQEGFAGGINIRSAADGLRVNQTRTCSNGILDTWGDVTKRLGTRRLHQTAIVADTVVREGFCWRTATTHEYLAVCNGRLYSGGTYSTAMSWTDEGAIDNTTVYPSFAAFRDSTDEAVFIADGATLRKYKASTLSAPASAATGISSLAVYNQRLFGCTGDDQNIHWSGLNDGDSLGNAGSGGGSAVIRTFSNQKITGLLTLKNSLAIFHVSGVSQFTGYTQDDIAISAGTTGLSSDVGTVAPRSLIMVDGVGYFLSVRGAYRITDSGVEQLDSVKTPDPTLSVLSALTETEYLQIDAVYDKPTETIRWSIPGIGVYVYHTHLRAWSGPWDSGYVDPETHCVFDGVDDDGKPITLVGGADGFVRQMDYASTYLDNVLYDGTGGTTYTLAVQCRRMFTGHDEAEKAWRWAYLFADLRGTVSASLSWVTSTGAGSYTLPNVSAGSNWGSVDWNDFVWGGTGARPFRIPVSGRGTYIDFTISDDGEARSVYSRLTVEAFDYGRRG